MGERGGGEGEGTGLSLVMSEQRETQTISENKRFVIFCGIACARQSVEERTVKKGGLEGNVRETQNKIRGVFIPCPLFDSYFFFFCVGPFLVCYESRLPSRSREYLTIYSAVVQS